MVVMTRAVGLVERVARPIVPVLERLALVALGVALGPTIPLLGTLTTTRLFTPGLPVIRVTVLPWRAAVTAAAGRPIAAAGSVGMRRFHWPGYRPQDSGCPWGGRDAMRFA
jgi:hypothetical protein